MAQLEIRTLHHTINNLTRYNENLTKEIEVSHLISFVWKLFIYHLTNLFICIFNANIAYLKNIKNFHAHIIISYVIFFGHQIRKSNITTLQDKLTQQTQQNANPGSYCNNNPCYTYMHLAVFAVGVFISAILIDAMVRTLCCPTFYLLIPFHFYHKTETKNVLQGHSCFLRFGYKFTIS